MGMARASTRGSDIGRHFEIASRQPLPNAGQMQLRAHARPDLSGAAATRLLPGAVDPYALIGGHGTAPDEKTVHVDVVKDGCPKLVRSSGGILPLVKNDDDPVDRLSRHDRRERRRSVPAEADPAITERYHSTRGRVAADEVNITVRRDDIEAGRACTTV